MTDNDNEIPQQTTNTQVLETILGYVNENLLQVGVGYVSDEETGLLTDSYIVLTSGELSITSVPEPLRTPLIPVRPEGATVQ